MFHLIMSGGLGGHIRDRLYYVLEAGLIWDFLFFGRKEGRRDMSYSRPSGYLYAGSPSQGVLLQARYLLAYFRVYCSQGKSYVAHCTTCMHSTLFLTHLGSRITGNVSAWDQLAATVEFDEFDCVDFESGRQENLSRATSKLLNMFFLWALPHALLVTTTTLYESTTIPC